VFGKAWEAASPAGSGNDKACWMEVRDNYKVLMVKSGNKKTQRNLIKKVCLEGYCTSLGD
jgi:hypothetical protein